MSRHFIVCIKAVMLEAPKGKAFRSVESCDLNPFDRPALEVAIRLREELGGQVTALSMGPDSCTFALCDALAMGVDRGVLLSDPAFGGSDTIATSTVLAAAIKKLSPCDSLFFGVRTADSDTAQVGPQTATLLNLPLVSGVLAIETQTDGLTVERRSDGFSETYNISFPAALTIHPSAVQPRDAALMGIADAYEASDIETWNMADLGLSSDEVGEPGSPTRVATLSQVAKERKCEFVDGEPEQQAEKLIQHLLEAGLIG
jgi:electron transfer flavoprotein beta subunit